MSDPRTQLVAEAYDEIFPPDVNRRLLTQAGFQLELDEVVQLHEPEGDVAFHWVLARR